MDSLDVYLRDIRHCCLKLSRQEIHELGVRWRDHNDQQAREQLVLCVLPWAVKIAMRYKGRGVDQMDLVSLANEGLMLALGNFDPDKGSLTTHVACLNAKSIPEGSWLDMGAY